VNFILERRQSSMVGPAGPTAVGFVLAVGVLLVGALPTGSPSKD
ncbi:uncharacterized protein METZ01_LOCUS290474, partial [marine metagenome]